MVFPVLLGIIFIVGCGLTAPDDPGKSSGDVEVSVYRPGKWKSEYAPIPEGRRSIVLTGDIMTWNSTKKYLKKKGVNYPFQAVAPLLKSADLTVGNLEGPIAVNAQTIDSRYPYKVPPWTLEGLTWAGYDLVSLANNHLYDCRRDGMRETFQFLKKAGLQYFGAGKNAKQAKRPKVVTVGETRVAFCGLLAAETWFHEYRNSLVPGAYARKEKGMRKRFEARKKRPGTTIATKESVVEMVKNAKKRSDLVVVFLHWGIRYYRLPTEFQREVGHAAIDAGADLVVGHHAHFWQPVELYHGKPIVYGLGNFAFGSNNPRADEGLVARAILNGDRLESVELFPVYIKNKDRAVRYQTKIMKDDFADDMLSRLAKLSSDYRATIAVKNGRGIISLPMDENTSVEKNRVVQGPADQDAASVDR